MNCGHATFVCLSQKFSDDGLHYYWDGVPPHCTTRVSDGFALALVDQNLFQPCLMVNL